MPLPNQNNLALIGRRPWTDEELNWVFDSCGGLCFYCASRLSWKLYGKRTIQPGYCGWEIDHYQPLANGGTNHYLNLVPACWECNAAKADGDPGDFLERRGVLHRCLTIRRDGTRCCLPNCNHR